MSLLTACPLPLQVLSIWQSRAVPVSVGCLMEEAAGTLLCPRLQPVPSPSEECLGGTIMHFVSPSQLVPTPSLPAWIPSLVVEGFCPSLSVLLPLRFLLQPPLGFLLIPIYSIFYKAFDFCNGQSPTPVPLQVSLYPARCPTETNDILPLETINTIFWELVLPRIVVCGGAHPPRGCSWKMLVVALSHQELTHMSLGSHSLGWASLQRVFQAIVS